MWHDIVSSLSAENKYSDLLKSGMEIYLDCGNLVSFWYDVWAGDIPLADRFPLIFALSIKKDSPVYDFGKFSEGVWEWEIPLRRVLSEWENKI